MSEAPPLNVTVPPKLAAVLAIDVLPILICGPPPPSEMVDPVYAVALTVPENDGLVESSMSGVVPPEDVRLPPAVTPVTHVAHPTDPDPPLVLA
jgi:hypothetical protein